MSPIYRKARLVLWIVGFGFLTWFLVANTPWHRWFKPDYTKEAAEGAPLVKAIYAYRNDRGLWPPYAEVLAPKFIPALPAGWQYTVVDGWPQVAREIRPRIFVGYDFDPDNRGWRAFGQLSDEKIPYAQEIPPEPKLTPEQRAEKVLAEYDRRLRAADDLPENWQNKGAYLHELGRLDDLKAFLEKAADHRPTFYWPRLALAVLEAERGGGVGDPFAYLPAAATAPHTAPASAPTTAATGPAPAPALATTETTTSPATAPRAPVTAGERFVQWAVTAPSFTNYFYVYAYARAVRNDAAAMRALELAMGQRLTTGRDDPYRLPYYLYRLARFAYQQGRYDTCLQICQEWADLDQAAKAAHQAQNRSYYPLAAAANLKLGNFDKAESLAQQAEIADEAGDHLWARQLDDLAMAIKRKDLAYTYLPNPDGKHPEYNVWERFDR
jgi:tetratricopeptide (TPR) repeat protein